MRNYKMCDNFKTGRRAKQTQILGLSDNYKVYKGTFDRQVPKLIWGSSESVSVFCQHLATLYLKKRLVAEQNRHKFGPYLVYIGTFDC